MAEQTQTTPGADKPAVGVGTDTMDIADVKGGFDPNAARKAMWARQTAGHQAEVELDREEHPEVEQFSAAVDSGQDIPMGDDADPDAIAGAQAIIDEQDAGTPATTTAATPAAAENAETVTLKVMGQTLEWPKDKVEAEGGVAVVQLRLAAEFRFNQATSLAKQATEVLNAANEKKAEVDRLEADLREKHTAAGAPASAQQPGAPTKSAAAGEDIRAAAKKVVSEMFSGDPESIENALTEVLAKRGDNPAVDAEQVANLVLAKVEERELRRDAARKLAQSQDAAEQERKDVNTLMNGRYKPIMENPEAKEIAWAMFSTAKADPRNKGRSLVSIADDVGGKVLKTLGLEVAAETGDPAVEAEIRTRKHMKRRIPTPSVASERAPAADDTPDFPTKPSDYINLVRAARGQTPM